MQTQMQVATIDQVTCIKVSGAASFSLGVDFKSVTSQCCEEGNRALLLDLSSCSNMDSTFLGILVGLTGRLDRIELLNPCERVIDLLENLGVLDLVSVSQGPNPFDGQLEHAESANVDKRELAEASLEAHRTLMHLNPENVPRFKDVTKFLEEDLGRQ
jgi:anti-anti-sigma regulatory factor